MNLAPSFLAGSFALAGLIFAAAPLIIHLLNRRRFRVVEWAAMEFLQDAIRRNRRILHLRDLLLLILRTAAVLLFGLALAQPYFANREARFDGSQPLHAIILLDNSRSMDFASLDGSLLDRAKGKASDLIKRLPDGSQISVIPTAGSRNPLSPDPYASKEHALDALGRIEAVDRAATLRESLNLARQASESAPLLAKRFVWLTDQQRLNFQALDDNELVADLQVVNLAEPQRSNSWIAELRIQDGVADMHTPATIVVVVRHEGAEPRRDLQVQLQVDGQPAGSSTITISPGGSREVTFQHTFAAAEPTPQRPASSVVTASITPDRLTADDRRVLIAHVAASAPVVFIDQYGADGEDPLQQRFGETRSLRRLLAPRVAGVNRQLVEVRHVTPDGVDRELLADARLVICAGVEEPGAIAPLLRQYVEQGGQLMLAAGAAFSPQRWTEQAWLDGDGLLPTPLAAAPIGATPDEAEQLAPFFVDFQSVQNHSFFQLSGNAEDQLRDLFNEPFFFKAVRAEWNADVESTWRQRQLSKERDRLQQTRLADQERDASNGAAESPPADRWLAWGVDPPDLSNDVDLEEEAERRVRRSQPRVAARFDNGAPMIVERQIGQGRVVLYTSGLVSPWSTIPRTNCFIIFDRILRDMMQDTFAERNFRVQNRIEVRLPPVDREVAVTLQRPISGSTEEIAEQVIHSGFLDSRSLSFNALQAGEYRLTANSLESENGPTAPLWSQAVAVHADPAESALSSMPSQDLITQLGESTRLLGADDAISLAGAQVQGQHLWWWLALVVLVLILAELAILSLPRFARRSASSPAVDDPTLRGRAA